MAKKNTKKPAEENTVQDVAPAADATAVTEKPAEENTVQDVAPVVTPGDHFKTVKIRFKKTVCADYGTFYQGEVGEIKLHIANELEKCGAGVIVKE